ncbi:MAG: hypothetical protein S4CHLAM102_05680 [Chlamydiia bacterium]|nr:hypothetical protein [Chlamydiia bacterium]
MVKKYVFLLLTGLIFGSQFVATKFALMEYSPLEVGMMRVVFGVIAVAILCPLLSQGGGHLGVPWYMYALIGFLEGTLPCILVPWGQQQVASGIASVIIATMPIFAMIFGPILVQSERYHWSGILSIVVGFVGVFILLHPTDGGGSIVKAIVPELSILLASASWALSLVLIKKCPHDAPIRLTRNILFAAAIEIVFVWLVFGHPSQIGFSTGPFISALLLGALGSGVVYIFFVLLIKYAGVNFAAFSNYLVPVVGVIIGVVFLRERFDLLEIVGIAVIVSGLLIETFFGPHASQDST